MHRIVRRQPLLTASAAIVAALLAPMPTAHALVSPSTQVVAVSGDDAPDSNGQFAEFPAEFTRSPAFENPSLSDNGFAAFRAFLTNTAGGGLDDAGVFTGNGTILTQVSRAGQSAAGNGIFNNYNPVSFNDAGVAAFVGFLGSTSAGNANDAGVYFGNGVTVTEVVREGDGAFGNGTFSDSFNTTPSINEAGQIAFRATLNGTTGGGADDTGVYLYTGGLLTEVVREGQAAPDADGVFGNLTSPPALNDVGQTAFYANMSGTANNQGIFRVTGSTITQIARVGQAPPDGDGTINSFTSGAALNNVGQVAYSAFINSPNLTGVFRSDGSTVTQIARAGQAAPDANGTFDHVSGPALNDAGQVAFYGALLGTAAGSDDNSGVFLGDGNTITQVARAGNAAPDGNGVFDDFFTSAINNAGQVAFYATLTSTTGGTADNVGIYLYDQSLGLITIVRKGDSLLGSTITALGFNGSEAFNGDERSGLNGLGQVAYFFNLADGRNGVAIATIPEPASALLLAAGGALLWRRR